MKLRKKIYSIIFESDTKEGRLFDVALIFSIIASVIVVMLDSVDHIHDEHGEALYLAEWFFTILFSIEYLLRLYSIGNPMHYAASFFGVVDFLSIVPTYISLLVPGTQFLITIRVLRVLRIFRVLKIVRYIGEANVLLLVLRQSRDKIAIFLFTVLTLTVIFGSAMYLIESEAGSGFTSIPTSVYWAIVTLTTVGYGDISPATPFGQVVASIIMVLGYSIIAIPTGIVTVEMQRARRKAAASKIICTTCNLKGHDKDANFCKKCGASLT